MQKSESKPHWFSIKEAAEYLDIGEPTLYRWMKDGQITYRKVGDSTRFWKEDLDAVMDVYPSAKDIDKVRNFCPLCHHPNMVEGRAQSTGLVYFRPKKTKFWTFTDSNVETQARMCSHCGFIIWFGDVAKLSSLKIETPSQPENGALPAVPEETGLIGVKSGKNEHPGP